MRLVARWKDVSIAKKLYFVVGIMAFLIVGELATLRFAMKTLSAARAFVGGEGLWSKSQKNAAISLQRYGLTRDEADFTAFVDDMRVPEGDHDARLELFKPAPDRARVRDGFMRGRIDPADIDPMIDLLTRFYWTSYLSRAIAIWGAADDRLAEFKAAGLAYHAAVVGDDSPTAARSLAELKRLNEQLTSLEDEFSYVLGLGSRWIEHVVLTLLTIAVLAVESVGLALTFLTSRSLSQRLNELNRAALRIGRADFSSPLTPQSRDEIGQLARSVNQMGQMLDLSYSDLEVRVKQRTGELARSRDELAVILKGISDGITVVDQEGRFVFVNEAGAKMSGAPSVEEFLRTPQTRVLERLVLMDEAGNAFPAERLPSRLAFAGTANPSEVVLRSRPVDGGDERWLIVKSAPVFDEQGHPRLVVTIFKDFTSHKRAEDGVRFLDEVSQVLASSLTYRETLRQVAELAVPRLAGGCTISLADAGEGPWSVTVGGVEAGQDDAPLVLTFGARGTVFGSLTLAKGGTQGRDPDPSIAEELARRVGIAVENATLYQLAQKAIRQREDFLSIASHELNTPLTSLRLQLHLAKQKVAQAQAVDGQADLNRVSRALDASEAQIVRLGRLVETLLDVSRLNASRLTFTFQRLNLSQLVHDTASRLSEALTKVGSSLTLALAPDVIGTFDQTRIEQVIDNLLINAIKYAPGKPVKVSLVSDGDRKTATLVVEDQGAGIPLKQQATLFDRFTRGDSKTSIGGLGLGLFIVKEVLSGQGGSVRLENAPGQGARFVIELPLEQPAREPSLS